MYTIEQFFRVRDALGGIEVDAKVFNSLLEVINAGQRIPILNFHFIKLTLERI